MARTGYKRVAWLLLLLTEGQLAQMQMIISEKRVYLALKLMQVLTN